MTDPTRRDFGHDVGMRAIEAEAEILRLEARQPDSEALRLALERLTDAASVEEEDWSPQTHDELVAALNQAGRALAALPPSDPVTSFDRESDVDTLRNAIHWSGMILVDQVSGKPVDDAEETVLRYARLSAQALA